MVRRLATAASASGLGMTGRAGDLFTAQDGAGGPATVAVTPCAPTPGPYDYLTPEGGAPPAGAYVIVPLGGRETIGVVWGPGSGDAPPSKLKPIGRVLDAPRMTAATMNFLSRAAAYTMIPLGEMARLATRAPGLDAGAPTERAATAPLAGDAPEAPPKTAARRRALETFHALAAGDGGPDFSISPSALARAAEVGASVVAGLMESGHLREVERPRDAPYPRLDPDRPGRGLSPEQAAAAEAMAAAASERAFKSVLLHGVTGSGKTEAYLEAIAACLRAGRQALVLMPEIALTEAFLARFETRFGARPAEWHSAVGGAARRRCWRAAASGAAQVVAGARSALMLPFQDLGLIIVDEEHDAGYKQEDGAIYHARDMAVLRASCEQAAVVLASATPSLETWVNAESGRYGRLVLPRRFGPAVEPVVEALDLRVDRPERDRWIAPGLAREVAETMARGEQALLFLNRRGYAPLTLCRKCGARFGCPHCDAWLVSHRLAGKLVCHVCGHSQSEPAKCPSCGSDELAACGPGVERLAEEARELFPDARLAILSSDAAPTAAALRERIDLIASGEADLVIGTQIVAKGHNFPDLTLVGVVDADLGLQGGDFRAAERTFQLLRQVAGRAGRAEKPGRAVLQTVAPDQSVMKKLVAGDERGFLEHEASERRRFGAPPFGRYLGVIFSGPDEAKVWEIARAFAREGAPLRAIGAEILGPAPAPIRRVRGKSRVRILVKAAKNAPIQAAATEWAARVKRRLGVRVVFDVDPQSFL